MFTMLEEIEYQLVRRPEMEALLAKNRLLREAGYVETPLLRRLAQAAGRRSLRLSQWLQALGEDPADLSTLSEWPGADNPAAAEWPPETHQVTVRESPA